jgi:hypothetical protein
MNLPYYGYTPNDDHTAYEFYSEGPKGQIRKMIWFNKVQERPVLIYNLAFGDVEEDGEINDAVISNNADRDRVPATVARSIHDFCDKHGNHFIFTQESTPARTRLYQMSIMRNLDEVMNDFDIRGLTNNRCI